MVTLDHRFVLNENVRVRRERFGLLFYDRRGPSLVFLNSKGLISPEFFQGRESARELITKMGNRGAEATRLEEMLTTVLTKLGEKGLIDAL